MFLHQTNKIATHRRVKKVKVKNYFFFTILFPMSHIFVGLKCEKNDKMEANGEYIWSIYAVQSIRLEIIFSGF